MDEAAEFIKQTNFTALDWCIVVTYPLISVFIGLYVRKLITNIQAFVVAGQGLGVFLGIATMTGTELGLITVMYSAQKGFTGGFAAFHIALAAGIVTFVVGLTGFLVYRLRDMGVMTIPEFYERRFDRKTRILGGIMMAFGGILNMGLFLKVGSMFIVGVTGLAEHSLALPLVMTFLILLVLVYTCLGGMVSVVVADYVQFVILSFGLLLTTGLAIHYHGWTNIFEAVERHMGPAGFDPTLASGTFGWEYIVWMGFLGLVGCAVWPTAVARALSMDSPQAVKRQYMFTSISFLIRFLIPYFWGICAFVFVMKHGALREAFFPAGYPHPDPLPAGIEVKDNLYAMPIFLGHILPIGLIGIITAGMVAAFMSTHDSYLLCWATVLTQDVVAPIYERNGRDLSSRARITLSRIFIVVIGLYVLYWGLIYEGKDDIWDYMAITGAIYFTGAFALLLGGLYWKQASSTGAFLALLAGCSAVLGLEPVQTAIGIKIPSARVGLSTVGFTLFVLVIGSLLFPDDRPKRLPRSPKLAPVVVAGLILGLSGLAGIFGWVWWSSQWELFWKIVLIGGVGPFAALAVTVTVGGFLDIGRLFRTLRQESASGQVETGADGPGTE
ncbi:MAG TPA: sodium:solute symporter family protein [Planctomycetaceae bacterium]|nr:sodium:solute symporter family protein [Planctomycetaceae bacterium]